ncbi:MAG: RNA methyltransferase [Pyrinomonadaceae bacterium]|nr:RNA methyltransferase [Phycisphaerales bacterium]
MPLITITNPADPRIAEYVGVRESELRKGRFDAPGGLFVAESELVVRRLIASPYRTRSVLTTHSRLRNIADLESMLGPDVPIFCVDQSTMDGIVGFHIHRGLLAIGERGPEPSLDSLLARARCAVVLEDLVNHDNLGGIFRNTAALAGGCFGDACILLSPRCADPLYRKSIRVSIGSALMVPFARLTEWPGDLHRIRRAGFYTLALTPSEDAVDLVEIEAGLRASPKRIAIVLGTEGPGLSEDAAGSSDARVRISMPGRRPEGSGSRRECQGSVSTQGDGAGAEDCEKSVKAFAIGQGVDSLNVSVAGAIALHRLFSHTPENF